MKKTLTLLAAGALAAASLSAQAQVTVDGVLNTTELTTGNYVLLGKYTNPRGFGDAGLISMYAASTATKVYIFLGGTVEQNGNAFQIFMKLPAATGVAQGVALPNGAMGTSFQNVATKNDLPINLAVALRSSGTTNFIIEGASYTNATTVVSKALNNNSTTATTFVGDGTAFTIPTDASFPMLTGARVAYKNSTGGKVSTNPGNVTPNTSATYGAAGTYGLEIELDRTAAGMAGATSLILFALQNSGDGGVISTDYIPQTSTPIPSTSNNGNPGTGAYDFTAVTDRQAATVTISATGGTTLGSRAADAAAVALSVYPNPVADNARVAYTVTEQASPVNIVLTDLLGRTLSVLENGVKPVGSQSAALNKAALPAGTYLVRVQVGERVSTSKVVVL